MSEVDKKFEEFTKVSRQLEDKITRTAKNRPNKLKKKFHFGLPPD